MTVIVPHKKASRQEAIDAVDQSAANLYASALPGSVQIVDKQKSWDGPVMTFSFTGKMGFISVPITGTVTVDDQNATVECELPSMVKNFLGEEKVAGTIKEKFQAMLHAGSQAS